MLDIWCQATNNRKNRKMEANFWLLLKNYFWVLIQLKEYFEKRLKRGQQFVKKVTVSTRMGYEYDQAAWLVQVTCDLCVSGCHSRCFDVTGIVTHISTVFLAWLLLASMKA